MSTRTLTVRLTVDVEGDEALFNEREFLSHLEVLGNDEPWAVWDEDAPHMSAALVKAELV